MGNINQILVHNIIIMLLLVVEGYLLPPDYLKLGGKCRNEAIDSDDNL